TGKETDKFRFSLYSGPAADFSVSAFQLSAFASFSLLPSPFFSTEGAFPRFSFFQVMAHFFLFLPSRFQRFSFSAFQLFPFLSASRKRGRNAGSRRWPSGPSRTNSRRWR